VVNILVVPDWENASFDLPVVQSAWFNGTGTVLISSEAGWSATERSAGIFDVTFPTSESNQVLVVTSSIETEDTSNFYQAQVQLQSATGCTVITGTEANSLVSLPFSIIRRLPDTSVANKVVVPSRAGEVVKEEIARITDPVSGDFDFTVPAGYDRLILSGYVQAISGTAVIIPKLYFNGDTTDANYKTQANYANNTSFVPSEQAEPRVGLLTTPDSGVGAYTTLTAVLEGPNSSIYKQARVDFAAYKGNDGTKYAGKTDIYHNSMTAAITTLKYASSVGAVGTLILYGERTL
jgi:hypothetical protein